MESRERLIRAVEDGDVEAALSLLKLALRHADIEALEHAVAGLIGSPYAKRCLEAAQQGAELRQDPQLRGTCAAHQPPR